MFEAALCKLLAGYFGGGVVVPPELFLPFFLAELLVDFLLLLVPVVVLAVLVSVLPVDDLSVLLVLPVAWAKDRVLPSNKANAMVSSFFIQSPSNDTSSFEIC